jgi:hypothetical protein
VRPQPGAPESACIPRGGKRLTMCETPSPLMPTGLSASAHEHPSAPAKSACALCPVRIRSAKEVAFLARSSRSCGGRWRQDRLCGKPMVTSLRAGSRALSVSSLSLAEPSPCQTRARGKRVNACREPGMRTRQQEPGRERTQQEEHAVQTRVQSSSERLDGVTRAKALGAVRAGTSETEAAEHAGDKSHETVSRVVSRFPHCGLPALSIAAGRGRTAPSTSAHRIGTSIRPGPGL